MRTRDGITLMAEALRPEERGRYPVILERTPYGRDAALKKADFWAERGYVYVAQDCRGRGNSGGEWEPFQHEANDGVDAIAWVARQPWCDGNVGTMGEGYGATAQWLAAIQNPPALRCIVPQSTLAGFPFENGIFGLSRALRWAQLFRTKRNETDAPIPSPNGLSHLPLGDLDRVALKRTDRLYQSWVDQPPEDDWQIRFSRGLSEVQIPSLSLSDWPDSLGTRLTWEASRRAERKNNWLVYGPWTDSSSPAGDLALRFFDNFLKQKAVGLDETLRVQAFVAGPDRWVSLDGWPSSTSSFETLYLAPGSLNATPGNDGAAVAVFDPKETAKEKGLFFKGEAFAKPTAIAGPFEVRLFFKSSAEDTDLIATILDVDAQGKGKPIGPPGRLRASYRDSPEKPSPLEPGRIYVVTVRPGEAACELGAGHRLALMVKHSDFPEYGRNLGTSEPLSSGKKMVKQRNVILTGTVTPSRITFRKLW